jgi:hypothetical protein
VCCRSVLFSRLWIVNAMQRRTMEVCIDLQCRMMMMVMMSNGDVIWCGDTRWCGNEVW